MMKKLLLVFAISVASFGAYAQSKIGIVDLELVFQGFYKTKIVESNLKRQSDIYKNYTIKLNESLTKLKEEFKNLRDSSQNLAMTDAARESKALAAKDKYRQVMAKEQELKDYTRDKMAQLRDERDRERARLQKEILVVVEKQAVLAGFTVVLDKSSRSISAFPVVLYNTKKIDMTQVVLKELNLGHEPKKNK